MTESPDTLRERVFELEQTLAALREQQAHWHLFSLATSNMLWNWNFADGSVERNIRFETAFGYSSEEVVPSISWWIDRLHPNDRERVLGVFQHMLDSGQSECSYEYRFRRRDGSYANISDNMFIVRDVDGRPIRSLGAMTDITERVRLAKRAQQLASLQSIGTVAAGIAHDFNNRLQGIVVVSDLLELRLRHTQEHRLAQQLQDHAQALGPLVSQLTTFAKGGAPVQATTNISELVTSNVDLVQMNSNIEITLRGTDTPYYADVDATQVGQVIHNLVINALQATPNTGRIEVGVRIVDAGEVTNATLESGEWIELSVRDTGVGIPPEQLDNIFDLYYTTKCAGSGLGLAIVWSVISRHAGHVRVESQPGLGSCFFVYLRPSSSTAESREPTADEPCTGAGRILVMDDQDIVRQSLELALTEFGYEVDGFEDGTGAVAAYERAQLSGRPYAAVIVDLTVPGGMGGVATKDAIRAIDPRARIIVASGYSDDAVLANISAYGFNAALRKPFVLSQLIEAVNDVIAE